MQKWSDGVKFSVVLSFEFRSRYINNGSEDTGFGSVWVYLNASMEGTRSGSLPLSEVYSSRLHRLNNVSVVSECHPFVSQLVSRSSVFSDCIRVSMLTPTCFAFVQSLCRLASLYIPLCLSLSLSGFLFDSFDMIYVYQLCVMELWSVCLLNFQLVLGYFNVWIHFSCTFKFIMDSCFVLQFNYTIFLYFAFALYYFGDTKSVKVSLFQKQ